MAAWLDSDPQERGEKPRLVHVLTTDATLEGLKVALENSPGVCFAVDELAGWVRAQNQYKGGKGDDRQQLLSMWTCMFIVTTRKGAGTTIIPEPFLSICGGIQPDLLGEL